MRFTHWARFIISEWFISLGSWIYPTTSVAEKMLPEHTAPSTGMPYREIAKVSSSSDSSLDGAIVFGDFGWETKKPKFPVDVFDKTIQSLAAKKSAKEREIVETPVSDATIELAVKLIIEDGKCLLTSETLKLENEIQFMAFVRVFTDICKSKNIKSSLEPEGLFFDILARDGFARLIAPK